MNKKYIAFGLMGFFAIALASAMVVNYLSATAELDVDVDYATVVSFANIANDTFPLNRNDGWSDSLTVSDTTQLSTILAGVQIINNADVKIEGKILKIIVSNALTNVDCNDITTLEFMDTATPIQLAKGFQNLTGLCVDDGDSIHYDVDINSLSEKTTYEYPAKVTFGAVDPTNYKFTSQMVIA